MDRKLICNIINGEMILATGCTEPAAIALTAAYARKYLNGDLDTMDLCASTNIIKNAMSAGIPGTNKTGMQYAAALGAVAGKVESRLQVIDTATSEEVVKAVKLVDSGKVSCGHHISEEKLYVQVRMKSTTGHTSAAVIAGTHTNLCYIEQDGKVLLNTPPNGGNAVPRSVISETLNIHTIYEFVESMNRETDDLHMIDEVIRVNTHIAEIGAAGNYGLNIGKSLRRNRIRGMMATSVVDDAVAATASGADARMAGANAPVVTNSGSGNQGITTTVPVVSAAKSLGIDEDRMFQAVTLSNLIAIHIHSGFGLLSGLCGATIAATGAACGIVYLLGGGMKEIGAAVNNMLSDVTGMLCDGAKANCALKISTCTYAAFHCAFMAMQGIEVQSTDGIVERDPEETIRNFTMLGNLGSPKMDELVLEILLNK